MAYLQTLYQRRALNATVRGAISAVRAEEDLEWIEPSSAKNYGAWPSNDRRPTFGGLETLQLISQGCKDRIHWSLYGLAVLSFMGVLRVGEAVSIRRRALGDDAMCFRGVKNSRRLFTRDLGTYAAPWFNWLKKHGSTGEKGSIFMCPQGPAWPEERIARALMGTKYEDHGWHCCCRGGTAVLKWMGYPSMSASGGGARGPAVLRRNTPPPPPISPSPGSAPCPDRSVTLRSKERRSPLSTCGRPQSRSTSRESSPNPGGRDRVLAQRELELRHLLVDMLSRLQGAFGGPLEEASPWVLAETDVGNQLAIILQ